MDSRYSRQVQLPGFGAAAQQKLKQAKVLVVGAGGLGVPVLQYLTGMGVGTLGLVDADMVHLTNLHRQVLYSQAEVGKRKVEVAAQKLALLNPEVTLKPYPFYLTVQNALQVVQEYDLVIDATDTFEARYLINDTCVLLKKPFVYGALHQFEGQVSVFNYQGGPTYRCLYPTAPTASEIPDCNTAGVLGVVPGLVGCQQALEAVKILTGIGQPLSGYLLMLDFLSHRHYKVKLKTNPENHRITVLQTSYALPACNQVPHISPVQLRQWLLEGKEFLLLDVREPYEYSQGHLQAAISQPLGSLTTTAAGTFPSQVPVVTFCQKGGRSQKAAELLLTRAPHQEVYSAAGGMEAWVAQHGNEWVVC